MNRRQSQALFSGAQWQDQSHLAQTETQEVASQHQETLFHCEGDWGLAKVTQGGCRVSIHGDIQKPSGHGPGQLPQGVSAWAAGLDQITSRGVFQPQPLHDSMNSFFQLLKVPPKSSPIFHYMYFFLQFAIIHKLPNGALHPTFHIVIKQYGALYQPWINPEKHDH